GSVLPASLRNTDHLRADSDSALIQRFNGNLVAFSRLAEHIRLRNPAILQDQLTGAGGANAELVFFFPDGKSGEVALYQESRNPFIPLIGIEIRKNNKNSCLERVRDPQLAAIQNKVIALVRRTACECECIAPRFRLRQSISTHEIPCQSRKVLLF